MILPGHVAAAILASHVTGADRGGSLSASMAPDLVDKPVRWVLGITPNDRIPMHTLVAWLSSTIIVWLTRGRRCACGWLVGYGSHLLCDEINAHLNPGRIYFWWPLKRYKLHTGPTGLSSSLHDFSSVSIALEAVISAAALWLWVTKPRVGDETSHV